MLSQIYVNTIVGLLCTHKAYSRVNIKFVLVHLVLYSMIEIIALLCTHKDNIIQT